jgi:hypothetical protein
MIARIEAHACGRFAGHFADERHAIDGGQAWELGTEGEFFFATKVELKACSMDVLSGDYFEVPCPQRAGTASKTKAACGG